MTKIENVIKRLQVQAQGTERANCERNLADCIWLMKHQAAAFHVDEIWEALLQDFEDLNKLIKIQHESAIARPLSYAINGLLTACLNEVISQPFDASIRDQILRLTWRIVTAWDGILAGDIDSIQEHVQLEETARMDR